MTITAVLIGTHTARLELKSYVSLKYMYIKNT